MGRPSNYTTDQVRQAIAIVEAGGQTPDGNTVKAVLTSRLGVSGGINAQSLGVEVARVIEANRSERMRGLVAALPDAATAGVKEHVDRLATGLTEQFAETYAQLQDEARREIVARDRDLARQHRLNDALETEGAEKDARLADLEQTISDLRAEAAEADRRDATLEAEIATLRAQLHVSEEVRTALIAQLGGVTPVSDSGSKPPSA